MAQYIDYSRYMDNFQAIEVFEALSNESRLEAFRLLVKAGPQGMPAGEIADELGVLQNTMSSHLQKLARAGLLQSERQSRHIIYSVDFETVRRLIVFLMEDCCRNSAAVCAPIARSLTA